MKGEAVMPVRRLCGLALLVTSMIIAGLPRPALAAPAAATSPVMPDLTPWMGRDHEPGEIAWQHAAHFSIAYEINPGHNTPAPVSTNVDAGYDADALWLRFQAQDPHPAGIRLHYREHDDMASYSDDYVGVMLSPFNDAQWAYEFFCTSGGTEWDAFRQQNNEYSSWDAVWSCNASRTATGYQVVMRIPLASIKFPHRPSPQLWGLIFFRNWPRNLRHQLFSQPLNYDSNCTLCSMLPVSTATPIEASAADFQLIPSITVIRTDSKKSATGGLEQGSPALKSSLDARWILRPDLEWSATANPNFSQVAPDVLQLSANRQFALFYQENRPFFEQGTQVFNTPSLRYSTDVFIPSGTLVDTLAINDPRFATKLVGQVGANEIGALATEDTATSIVLPGPQSSATHSFDFNTRDELLRYRRDVGASAFGVYASDRDGGGYHSGLYAADGDWQIDPSDVLTALVGSSSTDYPEAVASAFGTAPGTVKGDIWSLDYARTRRDYNFDLNLSHVAEGFRADLGYLPQVGYDQGAFLGEYDFYAPNTQWWQNSGFGTISNWTRATGGGPDLDRKIKLYTFVHANYQTHALLYATRDEQYFQGRTFALYQYELDATTQPTSWLNAEIDAVGVMAWTTSASARRACSRSPLRFTSSPAAISRSTSSMTTSGSPSRANGSSPPTFTICASPGTSPRDCSRMSSGRGRMCATTRRCIPLEPCAAPAASPRSGCSVIRSTPGRFSTPAARKGIRRLPITSSCRSSALSSSKAAITFSPRPPARERARRRRPGRGWRPH